MGTRLNRTTGAGARPASLLGVSVVEVGLAFFILGLAMIPIIGLFSSTGRQSRQTGDYGLAIALEEKVAEDLRLANWENVHLTDQIEADPSLTVQLSILDGQSPFFATIEDVQLPFGEIQTGVDPGISPSFQSLYRQLKSFRLGFSTRPVILATGTALDLSLKLEWEDFQRKRQDSRLDVRLARYGSWISRPPQVEDQTVADKLILELLYPSRTNTTLSAVAASTGADLATIRCVGEVAVLSKAVTDSDAEFQTLIANAQAKVTGASDSAAAARAQMGLARLFERRGASCLQVLCFLAAPITKLANTFEISLLGQPPPDRSRYLRPFIDLRMVSLAFDDALARAVDAYIKTYNAPHGPTLPRRLRTRVFMKILEVSKLKVLTTGPADTTRLQTMLTEFARFEEGRNSNFANFASKEKVICQDADTLRTHYPAQRYKSYRQCVDNSFPAADKVLGN